MTEGRVSSVSGLLSLQCAGGDYLFCDFAPLPDDWEPTKHVGEMLKPQRDHLGNVNDPDMWRLKIAMIRLLQKKPQVLDRGSIVEVLQILGASPDQIAQAQEGPAGEAVPLGDVMPAEGIAPMAAPPVPQAPPGRTRSSAAAVSASAAASAPSRIPRADAQPRQFSKFTDSQSISQSSV
uniref:Uncharacterized protein n=1 Tax=Chromera velia CCMP2878 TaxID=1169474 RepID=A0A0G4HGW2_9ALVE|eukprot:Cvel_6783.t1-p1 / transcript=Cvel_6783.t1 / gene=Cvel_6783 / organism=Chromera_velia_CCMP2878 / gene_product=hypothetical protein / transcript_product=hypothetical protein / location=Cvel_scaffold341:6346-7165(+) / protein_length=178 / sequence_SO=supercontig / SO=protein_coding / is_pseudo=false